MGIEVALPNTTRKWFVIDFFIHKRVRENSDFLYRARVMVLILATEISLPILASLAMLLGSFPPQMLSNTLSAGLIGMLPQIAALYTLKNNNNYRISSWLVIAQTFIGIVAVTFLTGGPFESPTAQLLGVPCLIAFYFGGHRVGTTVSILAIFTVLVLIAMQLSGFRFPQIFNDAARSFLMSFTLLANFLIVTILALAYELTFFLVKKEHDQEHEKFVRLAKTDPLTGLANRRIFEETLAARIELYSKLTPVRSFGLCYLDLDKFKPINDQFGHDIGDEVLRAISMRLRSALRGADFMGRHGGDEFLMLLDSVQDTDTATALLQRFLQLIQEPIETNVGVVTVGGSLGFAIFPQHGADFVTLQKAADDAMYEAKRNHGGFIICSMPMFVEK